jgi:hypothetical protein
VNETVEQEFEMCQTIKKKTLENQDKIFVTQTDNWSKGITYISGLYKKIHETVQDNVIPNLETIIIDSNTSHDDIISQMNTSSTILMVESRKNDETLLNMKESLNEIIEITNRNNEENKRVLFQIVNKPAIKYEKNFESLGKLIKSYAPHQTIESKSKE